MNTTAGAESNQIQLWVQQLYENEGLTNALTDEGANVLLDWGERQLKGIAAFNVGQSEFEQTAHQLQRVMRAVNRVIELKTELTDTQMVQRLLTLVEQAMELAHQKSIAQTTSQEQQ